nr:serine/threonine-protein kinase mTOR [Propylea japonica]
MSSAAMEIFIAGLKSKSADTRNKTANDLSQYLKTELREATPDEINNFCDDFNHHIFKMVSSPDVNEKMGGLLAIVCLTGADFGNMTTRISRFANYLRNLIPSNDVGVMELAAKTMGRLALVFSGSKASEYVEFEVKRAFEWLGRERFESRRHAAVLILKELAITVPTYFYQQVSPFFDSIFYAVQDPKTSIREDAVEALRAALVVTAQRETARQNQKPQWYKQCYDEFAKLLSIDKGERVKDERIHGGLLIMNELLRCSNATWERKYKNLVEITDPRTKSKDNIIYIDKKLPKLRSYSVFGNAEANIPIVESLVCQQLLKEKFEFVCTDILNQRASRSAYVQQTILTLLPRLAAFDRKFFVKDFLNTSMTHLFTMIGKGREKDRGICFVTLGLMALAVENDIEPYLDKIMEAVRNALPKADNLSRKRAYVDSSIFKCITYLAHALEKHNRMDISNLLDQMLASGLTPSLTICLRELAKKIPPEKEKISVGLLKMLSTILLTKTLVHPGMPGQLILQYASIGNVPETNDSQMLVLALNTLGTFDFKNQNLVQFIQRCSNYYTTNDSQDVRLEAVKTTCRLLKKTLQSQNEDPNKTMVDAIAKVLERLLVVGVTDTDPSVRFGVLTSLDPIFDSVLSQADVLTYLFIAMQDEVFEIREVALFIYGRLSTKNPAYIIPSLRKILIQFLTELEHSGLTRNREQAAKMLDRLVVSSPQLIRPYVEPVLKSLVPKLKNCDSLSPGVTISMLYAVGDLAEVTGDGAELQNWMSDLMSILLEMLGDASDPDKRGASLKTLGQLVGATGHIIQPYSRYPNLLDVLINFLKTEQQRSIRRETLRVLGLLGALDPYRHKINRGEIDCQRETPALIAMADKTEDVTDLTSSEMLVNMSQNTLEEYYLAIAIATLMKILKDPTLFQHHTMVVQAVTFIFKSLGIKCVPYIPKVMPSLLTAAKNPDVAFREFLFQQLAQLIVIVKQHIRNYLDDICKLIDEYWTPESTIQPTLILLVEHLAMALGTEFKVYLPSLMPQILRVLHHDNSRDRLYTMKLLLMLPSFGSNLTDYLHLILPPIVKLFDSKDCTTAVSKQALQTVQEMAEILDLSDFASRIIHPIIRTIDNCPELRQQAMETTCAVMLRIGKKFNMFIPLIQNTLHKHKLTHQKFDILVSKLQSKTTMAEDIDFPTTTHKTRMRINDVAVTSDATINKSLKVSESELQKAWTPQRRVSKEDWLEWLRRLSIELLIQSPIPALRSCLSLAQSYSQLPRDLFNAAFVSCWNELSESMQSELIACLQKALTVPDVPEITQTILNLAEFMDHCDKGPLPLDQHLLGEHAMRSRAYAKALHYKEEEFLKNPNSTVVEALISINNKLQQKEAAEGLLQTVVQKCGETEVQIRWHEKLHNWTHALDLYKEKLEKEPFEQEACLGTMRCLEALGEWKDLHDTVETKFELLTEDNKNKACRLAASASFGLLNFRSMERYASMIPKDSQEGSFYRAILAIHKNQYEVAQNYIDKTRDLLDTELTAMAGESYQRAYGAMVQVQILAELEEVMQYRLVPERRPTLKSMWWQRLQSGQRLPDDWQKILLVQSLVLSPQENIHAWLKYASLCQDPEMNPNFLIPHEQPYLVYAYTKHLWTAEKQGKAYQLLGNFVRDFVRGNNMMNNIHILDKHNLLARCYLKLGNWQEALEGVNQNSIAPILKCYQQATDYDPGWYKAWHAWAYMNFESVLFYKNKPEATTERSEINYAVDAVQGFFKSIKLSRGSSLQDTLRLLTLWFDYGHSSEIYDAMVDGIRLVEKNTWLQVIPQLIARIDTPRLLVSRLIHHLLIDIGKTHPQALVYPLTVATKSNSAQRRNAANKILKSMSEHSPVLVSQAKTASEELIRVAILWHEMWHEGLEEASRLYFGERNAKAMLRILEPLHAILDRGPQTLKETSFTQAYARDLNEAANWCQKYKSSSNTRDLNQAWDLYYHVFRRISRQLPQLTSLELQYVSPNLQDFKNLELAVPGSYSPGQPIIRIQYIHRSLEVITSKQRPRKLRIRGSDGKDYMFLLKGHEDLRQDERVMQLFGLVNTLLLKDPDTFRRNLTIQRYAVIPLNTNSGLIGWVPHCDTLHTLIRDYRDKKKILLNIEHRIMLRMAPDYDHLTVIQKVEVFEHALEHTHGDDLAKLLWLKSPSSEVWFDRRTNYTRSLAVMSMVGYILGLGDRHPSNLMLDRLSGKILHIDFGDCFEVAMTRDKFPEKIPFRLTRMLVNAMEVTHIEGTYRRTCESVMNVLRRNKDSLMAVLEAFVYDPLLNWRLLDSNTRFRSTEMETASTSSIQDAELLDTVDIRRSEPSSEFAPGSVQPEALNRKAVVITNRVKDKLTGKDFGPDEVLTVQKQVDLLIRQATSNENLCQCYIGWCPFW